MRPIVVVAEREGEGIRVRIRREPYHHFDRALPSTVVLPLSRARALRDELDRAIAEAEATPAPAVGT